MKKIGVIIILTILIFLILFLILFFIFRNRNDSNEIKSFSNTLDQKTLPLIKELFILSSNDRAVIVFRNKVVKDEYHQSLILLILDGDKIEYLSSFCNNYRDIKEFVKVLDQVPEHFIIIIVTRGDPFRFMFKNISDQLIKLGSKIMGRNFIYHNYNYILITNKLKNIYYESLSDKTIYYPNYKVNSLECKNNPFNISPLKNYIFYRNVYDKYESIYRCALETMRGGNTVFGIADNKCIPLTNQYYDNIRKMSKSSTCIDGHGNYDSISLYNVTTNNKEHGIYIYGYSQIKKLLPVGIYSRLTDNKILDNIIGLDIPQNYVVYLVDQYNRLFTLYGKKFISDLRTIDPIIRYVKDLIVETVDDKTKICDGNKCLVFGPGRHRLSPYLYIRVNDIKFGPDVNKVILYNDMDFISVIDNIDKGSSVYNTSKFTRSLEII